jgi:carboxyl-terminal processing protease
LTVSCALILLGGPALARAATGIDAILKEIRDRIADEQDYTFGEAAEYVLEKNKALRLRCGENPDGIDEVLVCWSGKLFGRENLFIYCITKEGRITGGGSPLPTIHGALRAINRSAAIASWDRDGGRMHVALIVTDDSATATQHFRPLFRDGAFSTMGNWGRLIDRDRLTLTADERLEVFVRLWTLAKYNFANFDLVPEVDWDEVLREYLPRVRREQSNTEFSRLLCRCVAQLRDGHTEVGMRLFPAFPTARPPLRIEPVGGAPVIMQLGTTEEIKASGLQVGDEIVAIDGRGVREVLEAEVYPYVFASTPQARDLKAFPNVLVGTADQTTTVRVRDLTGDERDVVLTRVGNWHDFIPPQERGEVFEIRNVGEEIVCVTLRTFGTRAVADAFAGAMDQIRAGDGLIIDVRENGGGSTSNGWSIISHLIDKPIPGTLWKTPKHVAAFEAWGRPERWHFGEPKSIQPAGGEAFDGPVVVLIGPRTFSAAEDFVVPLHASGRAVLVGERTGGSTGQPLPFSLPFGVRGRICTKRDTYPDGREFVGVGVIPDVEVGVRRAAAASGRDPVLARGIKVLREMIDTGWGTPQGKGKRKEEAGDGAGR